MASAGSLPAICLRPLLNRPACDFSALASVSNHSASSAKPSSRAVLAMPGYIWVYSYVSPATADLRFFSVLPIGSSVTGSPTSFRKSRCPNRPVRAGRHVVDAAAGDTREVVVRRRVAVEAHTGGIGALRQELLGGERSEISIDRRQAHARQPPSHAPVDERRGRVSVGGADDLEDDPALSRQPEAPGVERGVERERSDIFSNHYQQA